MECDNDDTAVVIIDPQSACSEVHRHSPTQARLFGMVFDIDRAEFTVLIPHDRTDPT